MAVLAATPFLPPFNVRFRRGRANECAASECELVSRDLWEKGWGRVQVVPSVQVCLFSSHKRKEEENRRIARREKRR